MFVLFWFFLLFYFSPTLESREDRKGKGVSMDFVVVDVGHFLSPIFLIVGWFFVFLAESEVQTEKA